MTVDPRREAAPFASGTRTLLRGERIFAQRHLRCDQVWFVHKGQGRAIVDAEDVTVVPGSVISIPNGSWHSLRNTGTGVLQIVWTAAPAGIEEWYRQLAQRGGAADAVTLQELAARYGIEFRPDDEPRQFPGRGEPAAAATLGRGSRRRRHRRGGRGRGSRPSLGRGEPRQGASPQQASAPAAAAPEAPVTPSSSPGSGRRGRRRPPSSAQQKPAPKGRGPRRDRAGGRRFGRVKEVYMDGRWIRISGEGPVISSGSERPREAQEGVTRDDTPPGPLSVPL